MKKRTMLVLLGLAVIGAAVLYGWPAVQHARHNLVTLNVRQMDVRKVVRKIEWQTWEDIFVHRELQGQVTLDVYRMPLEEVLRVVADQTSSRWNLVYPIYSSGRSLTALKKSLRGDLDPMTSGWTNLNARGGMRGGFGFGGPGGRGGGPDDTTNQLVSLRVDNKDLDFAIMALSRFGQARVVPEDGLSAKVTFSVTKATPREAVAKLASSIGRKSQAFYSLRPEMGFGFAGFGAGGPGGRGGPGGDGGTNAAAMFAGGPRREMTDEQREAERAERAKLEEELRNTLPAAERQQLELAQQQREQQFREMQNLTPEERRQRMGQAFGGAGVDRRNADRLRNSTPEQRAQQNRRMSEMRKRFEQRGAQGGQPGQPGQPGQGPGRGRGAEGGGAPPPGR